MFIARFLLLQTLLLLWTFSCVYPGFGENTQSGSTNVSKGVSDVLITSVVTTVQDNNIRVIVTVDREFSYNFSTQYEPACLIIDIPSARFADSIQEIPVKSGLLRSLGLTQITKPDNTGRIRIGLNVMAACIVCKQNKSLIIDIGKNALYDDRQVKLQQTAESKIENLMTNNPLDYAIGDKDILYITVYNEPELSYDQLNERSLRVSTDGKISFPLLGDIEAAGLTPFQLGKKLERLLGDGYLINPHVSVMVGNYHGSACVIGQVKNPGEIKLQDREITVVEAISMAGGFTDIASPNRTYIVRMENGVKKIIPAKVNKIIKDKKDEDIVLKPGDTVVVPEALF